LSLPRLGLARLVCHLVPPPSPQLSTRKSPFISYIPFRKCPVCDNFAGSKHSYRHGISPKLKILSLAEEDRPREKLLMKGKSALRTPNCSEFCWGRAP
jgi:hypothetical protein